jgi:cysteine desulfurase
MILTTKGRYSVMAVLHIAKYGKDKSIALADIAEKQGISLNYLEQIFARLKKADIVESIRGPGGGYRLSHSPSAINIYSITNAVEEEITITKCGNKQENTCLPEAVKCLAHDLWNGLEGKIINYLRDVTIADVLNSRNIADQIYLDYNATSPMLPEVKKSIYDALGLPNNPSSIHYYGRNAKRMIEDAREKIADRVGIKLGRDDYEICFTSSGTEANNLLLYNFSDKEIAISATEHLSILEPAKQNPQRILVEVDKNGMIDLDSLNKALEIMTPKSLVSIIFANNETGVVQDIKAIAKIVHGHGMLLHSDCVQAFGKIDLDITEMGLDFVTISAHKIGGPVGSAALVHRAGLHIKPQIIGGGQEKGMRAGTENIASIVGFGKAAELAKENLSKYASISNLRDKMEKMIIDICPESIIFGQNVLRLPNTSMINMPGVDVQTQLIYFDLHGISLSGGSACSSGKIQNSHVLSAMGYKKEEISGAVRVSLGVDSTLDQVEKFVSIWERLWKKSNIRMAV